MDPIEALKEALLALELRRQEQQDALDDTRQEILRTKKALQVLTSNDRVRNSPSDHNKRIRASQQSQQRVLEELKQANKPILARELAARVPEYTAQTVASVLTILKKKKLVDWDGYDNAAGAHRWVAL